MLYHVLFFIELHTRRVHIAGITANPDSVWMANTARGFRMWLEEEDIEPSFIIRDGDTKFVAQFDAILETTGAKVKEISYKSPNLNAYAEAWVGTIKRECMDNFVVFGERHLEHLTNTFVRYYNSVRVHSSLDNSPIGMCDPPPDPVVKEEDGVVCHSWLGGLLRHYGRAA